jgi:ribosomal protein S18 acetylase RimI-like enzyme
MSTRWFGRRATADAISGVQRRRCPTRFCSSPRRAARSEAKAVLDFNLRRDAAWLWLVSVDPAYRGRGVGPALMRSAELDALARDHRVIELAVNNVNPRARALYERLGYRAVGPYSDHVRDVNDEGNTVSRDEPGTLLRHTLP